MREVWKRLDRTWHVRAVPLPLALEDIRDIVPYMCPTPEQEEKRLAAVEARRGKPSLFNRLAEQGFTFPPSAMQGCML